MYIFDKSSVADSSAHFFRLSCFLFLLTASCEGQVVEPGAVVVDQHLRSMMMEYYHLLPVTMVAMTIKLSLLLLLLVVVVY